MKKNCCKSLVFSYFNHDKCLSFNKILIYLDFKIEQLSRKTKIKSNKKSILSSIYPTIKCQFHQFQYINCQFKRTKRQCFNFEQQYINFQMESTCSKEGRPQSGYKIYFPENTFGKPTKNRKQDPNMFELLTWDVDGFEKHSFKKDEKFNQSTEAYLNMIGRNPWTSESRENYLNFQQHCIEANPDVLHKIENYIQERLPQKEKEERRSPQKQQKSREKLQKKENKYQPNNYMSPKGVSTKQIPQQEVTSPKNNYRKASIADARSAKKMKIVEEGKIDGVKGGESKIYTQAFEKSNREQQEITENDQAKLIENFKQTTRWIPNSAFTTYFGKPPFENYGRGNTHPIDGGLVYGTYLYSHNVHPHRGKNNPKNMQSYPVALMKAKSQGTLIPNPPRTKPDYSTDLLNTNVAEIDHRSKIQPQHNNFIGVLDISVPRLSEMQKFGGKRKTRVNTENTHTHA